LPKHCRLLFTWLVGHLSKPAHDPVECSLSILYNGRANSTAELNPIAVNLTSAYSDMKMDRSLLVRSLRDPMVGDVWRDLLLLLQAVALLVLIACGNVAKLLPVRASTDYTIRKSHFSIDRGGGYNISAVNITDSAILWTQVSLLRTSKSEGIM
jgi:hypothetical protein